VNKIRHNLRGGAPLVLASAVLWGTTGTAAAFAPAAGPLAIGAASMGVGGLMQACIAARAIQVHRVILARNRYILALSALAAAMYPLAFYSSMRMAGVAVGTAISIGSAPLFAAIVDFFSGPRRPSCQPVWALTIGVAGVTLLAFVPSHGAESTAAGASRGLGVALGLAAGATYAFYTWGATQTMRSGCPSRAVMGTIFGSASVLLLPALVVTGRPIVGSLQAIGVVTYLAIVPMFLGYLMFGKGLETTRASTATTLTLLEPAAAALIAVVVLGERLPAIGWFGLVVLLVSLASMTSVPAQSAPESAPTGRRSPPCTKNDPAVCR
jgi:DME family drug/metabolite transporter